MLEITEVNDAKAYKCDDCGAWVYANAKKLTIMHSRHCQTPQTVGEFISASAAPATPKAQIIGNVTGRKSPGGTIWTCTCGEGDFQGDYAVEKGIAPGIPHRSNCSLYVEPSPRTLNPLLEENYRTGRNDDNSDTM